MSSQKWNTYIERHLAGDLGSAEFEELQSALKEDSELRTQFLEKVDLEASLRTWATESPPPSEPPLASRSASGRNDRLYQTALAIVALVGIAWVSFWFMQEESPSTQQSEIAWGTLRQGENCVWGDGSIDTTQVRFSTGTLVLNEGVAELRFDTGTTVTLEAPCEFCIADPQSAELLAGKASVTVGELSDGFTLQTPDASIQDLDTEYVVALNDDNTEVHVLSGTVNWQPHGDAAEPEPIEALSARRFSRLRPQGLAVPFEERMFVRFVKARMRQRGGAELLSFDGFETPTRRIRNDRNGFGWRVGWRIGGTQSFEEFGSFQSIEPDVIFGEERLGNQVLLLDGQVELRRDFVKTYSTLEHPLFASVIIRRRPLTNQRFSALRMSLIVEQNLAAPRGSRVVSFGISSEGFPFLKSGTSIQQSAPTIIDNQVYLLVVKLEATPGGEVQPLLRLYHAAETLGPEEPEVWTIRGALFPQDQSFRGMRLSTGDNGNWELDNLRVGSSWYSVTNQVTPQAER